MCVCVTLCDAKYCIQLKCYFCHFAGAPLRRSHRVVWQSPHCLRRSKREERCPGRGLPASKSTGSSGRSAPKSVRYKVWQVKDRFNHWTRRTNGKRRTLPSSYLKAGYTATLTVHTYRIQTLTDANWVESEAALCLLSLVSYLLSRFKAVFLFLTFVTLSIVNFLSHFSWLAGLLLL